MRATFSGTGTARASLRTSSLDLAKHVVVDDAERGLERALQLEADLLKDRHQLLLGEVDGQRTDRLNVVEGLDPLVAGVCSWKQLQHRPRLVADEDELRSGIRVHIALAEKPED